MKASDALTQTRRSFGILEAKWVTSQKAETQGRQRAHPFPFGNRRPQSDLNHSLSQKGKCVCVCVTTGKGWVTGNSVSVDTEGQSCSQVFGPAVSQPGVTVHPTPRDIWQCLETFQFSSVAQLCPTLCDPMDCSRPALPVHHQLPEFTQTHVH